VAVVTSTSAFLQRNYKNTGDIEHRIIVPNTRGNTRFLFAAGVGYDFFIADFIARNNRVRITPFAEVKAGSSIITSNKSD
jgi:hypothetical protein